MKVRAPKAIRFRFLKWSSHFCGSNKNKSRKSVDTTLRTSKNNIYHHIECLCARILLACVCLASVVASLYCISNVSFPFPTFPCLYLENDEKQNLSLGAPGFLLLLAALHFLVTLGCFWLSWIFRFFWSAWLRVPFRTCLSAWPLAWFRICWSICCGFLKLFAQQNHLFVFQLRQHRKIWMKTE